MNRNKPSCTLFWFPGERLAERALPIRFLRGRYNGLYAATECPLIPLTVELALIMVRILLFTDFIRTYSSSEGYKEIMVVAPFVF